MLKDFSAGMLPPAVVADTGQRMQEIKTEIETLDQITPPPDYTPDYIKNWLDSLKNEPDEKAVHLLIERIDRISTEDGKTAFNVTSTLKAILVGVAGEHGRGDKI